MKAGGSGTSAAISGCGSAFNGREALSAETALVGWAWHFGLQPRNEWSRRIIFSGKKHQVRALEWQRRQRSETLQLVFDGMPPGA